MSSEALHVKYRPQAFDDVVGQDAVCKSLARLLQKGTQSFLLSGPSGTGKTTLARIAAAEMGCRELGIREVDAASHTGIDAMRQVTEVLQYRPMGESDARCIIVDECHALSKQAWQSLLKATEEPPEHVYFFFCTTELGKVPATIKTRCAAFVLKPVADDVLEELGTYVAKHAKIKVASAVMGLVVKEALGSPRQMLVNLAVCDGITDRAEAASLLRSAHGSDEVIELCRFMVKGGSFQKAAGIVGRLGDVSPESVRIQMANYLAACIKNARSDRDACGLLSILEHFATPYNQSEGMAPLLLSIGRVLFAPE